MRYILIALTFFVSTTFAQKVWETPAEDNAKLSPITFSDKTAEKGKEVFMKNCASCHGTPTQGTVLPTAGDMSDAKFKDDQDGELFFKISTGRGAMPAFNGVLSPIDIWNIVSYIRTFHDGYTQKLDPNAANVNADVYKMVIEHESNTNLIKVTVKNETKNNEPVKDMPVSIFAKRSFGSIEISASQITNEQGVVLFEKPKTFPGDSIGMVEIFTQIMPQGALEPINQTAKLQIGEPTNKPSLTKERAMWNKLTKIPLWLLSTYLIVVLTIFGFITYTMLLLKKIFEKGKDEIEKNIE